MSRHRAICEGPQIFKELAKMMEEVALGHRSFDEGFEYRYGYSLCEFAANDEGEDEDDNEPIIWSSSNM